MFNEVGINFPILSFSTIISQASEELIILDLIFNLPEEPIDGNASPLKPYVFTFEISLSINLDVACLDTAIGNSSLGMPHPLSFTWIIDLPPWEIIISMEVAPASTEFSTNSFTTDAGL